MACSHDDLLRLMRYSTMANRLQLNNVVLATILKRVDAVPRSLGLLEALAISEEYQWRDMEGQIYYRILCEAVQAASSDTGNIGKPISFQSKLPRELSQVQVSHIVQGFFNLNVVHDHIMESLPATDDSGYMNQLSSSAILNVGRFRKHSVDVVARLRSLSAVARSSDLSGISHTTIDEKLHEVEENLANYFLGHPVATI